MKESKRTKFLKELYKDEIKDLVYEEYYDSALRRRVRTGFILNDEFSTYIKLDELGVSTNEMVNDLISLGYKYKESSKILIRK